MLRHPWICNPAGLWGPSPMVELVDRQLEADLAAIVEGLPVADEDRPLLTALLLLQVAMPIVATVDRWTRARETARLQALWR